MTWMIFKSQRVLGLLNTFGIALGLSSCLAILLYVLNETSYDGFHHNPESIFRVDVVFESMENTQVSSVSGAVAPYLVERKLTKNATRIAKLPTKIKLKDMELSESNLIYADSNFETFFSFTSLKGNLSKTLSKPNEIAITESLALKLFGNIDSAYGERVLIEGTTPAMISTILANLPKNTHLDFSAVTAISTLKSIKGSNVVDNWMKNDFYTYIRLEPQVDLEKAQFDISSELSNRIAQIVSGIDIHFDLINVMDIYLKSKGMNEMKPSGDVIQIILFVVIAFSILILALFNYINISIAIMSKRARELGIRSAIGAGLGDLSKQFTLESIISAFVSFFFATVLLINILPYINSLLSTELSLSLLGSSQFVISYIALFAFCTLTTTLYPIFIVTRLNTVSALNNSIIKGEAGKAISLSMLFIQVLISIVLLSWGGHIILQFNHINETDIGYNKDNVILVEGIETSLIQQNIETLFNLTKNDDQILTISSGEHVPTQQHGNFVNVRSSLQVDKSLPNVKFTNVYPNFFETLGTPLIAGREFSFVDIEQSKGTLTQMEIGMEVPIIINEKAAGLLFNNEISEAIGRWVDLGWDAQFKQAIKGKVIGVTKNYYTGSIHESIQPMVFFTGLSYQKYSTLMIRYKAGNYSQALSNISDYWSAVSNTELNSISLLAQKFNNLHKKDEQQFNLVKFFSVLSVIILIIGLTGLVKFASQRKLKALAVHGVLGATFHQKALILGKEFLKTITIASFISLLISGYITNQWLSGFSSSIDHSPLIYVSTIAFIFIVSFSVLLAIMTVSEKRPYSELLNTE